MTILLTVIAVVALLMLAGAVYQAIGSARDWKKYPPPGRLVDVGGRRLHMQVTGEGGPTVILDGALGGSSVSWALVQREVSRFTRVCSYDRAGLGWSDAPPPGTPQTARQCAEDLHALLTAAQMPGPYILVGHSFGGFVTRCFAQMHPDEGAGLVLVDVPHPREWLEMAPEARHKVATGARLSRRGAWAARLGLARFISLLVTRGALGMARMGASMVSGGTLQTGEQSRIVSLVDQVPAQLRSVLKFFWTQPKFYDALTNHIGNMPETAAQIAATGPFGDVPLVVLTACNPSAQRLADQEEVSRLSTRGRHIIAARSGHWIPLDEPELVIRAIREVLEAACSKTTTSPRAAS